MIIMTDLDLKKSDLIPVKSGPRPMKVLKKEVIKEQFKSKHFNMTTSNLSFVIEDENLNKTQ